MIDDSKRTRNLLIPPGKARTGVGRQRVLILVAAGSAIAIGIMALVFSDRFPGMDQAVSSATNRDRISATKKPDRSPALPSGGMAAYCRILATQVRTGQTVEQVERLLGPGEPVTGIFHDRRVDAVRQWQLSEPQLYPASSRPTDQFKQWPIPDGGILLLQFREGKLINHAPESFNRTESP